MEALISVFFFFCFLFFGYDAILSFHCLVIFVSEGMASSDKPEVVERDVKEKGHKEDDKEEGKGGFIEKSRILSMILVKRLRKH